MDTDTGIIIFLSICVNWLTVRRLVTD